MSLVPLSDCRVHSIDIDVSVNKLAVMTTVAPWSPTATSSAAPVSGSRRRPAPDLAGTAAERLLVIVAPSNGRFAPHTTGSEVAAGEVVAHVTGGGHSVEVRAPVAARVKGLLTAPGQLVLRGQALAWAVVTEGATA